VFCDIGPVRSLRLRAIGQSLDRRSLCLQLDVRVASEHSGANVSGDVHDHAIRNTGLAQR